MVWIFEVKFAMIKDSVAPQTFLMTRASLFLMVYQNVINPNFPGTNECADPPCQNGGTCLDLEKDHYCVCVVGWSGDNCTISKDNNPFFVN